MHSKGKGGSKENEVFLKSEAIREGRLKSEASQLLRHSEADRPQNFTKSTASIDQ